MKKLFITLLLLGGVVAIQTFERPSFSHDVQSEEITSVQLGYEDSRHLPINGETHF